MFSFKPKNTKFYDHFERLAAIIVETAEQVERYFIDFDRRTEYVQKVKELEHQADEVTHQAMALLHKSFITPFDRGDIRRLLMSLDDVIDFMDSAMGRCQIYDVQVMAGQLRPGLLGLTDSTHRLALSTPDMTFWASEDPKARNERGGR